MRTSKGQKNVAVIKRFRPLGCSNKRYAPGSKKIESGGFILIDMYTLAIIKSYFHNALPFVIMDRRIVKVYHPRAIFDYRITDRTPAPQQSIWGCNKQKIDQVSIKRHARMANCMNFVIVFSMTADNLFVREGVGKKNDENWPENGWVFVIVIYAGCSSFIRTIYVASVL